LVQAFELRSQVAGNGYHTLKYGAIKYSESVQNCLGKAKTDITAEEKRSEGKPLFQAVKDQ
jgi:hypothetical protein